MRSIYGIVSGLIGGFLTAILLAPRSGKDTRKKLRKNMNQQLYEVRMAYHKLALKLGIGSRKKIAALTQKKRNELNKKQNGNNVNPSARGDHKALEKMHERGVATKAMDSAVAKSYVRKVPTKP